MLYAIYCHATACTYDPNTAFAVNGAVACGLLCFAALALALAVRSTY